MKYTIVREPTDHSLLLGEPLGFKRIQVSCLVKSESQVYSGDLSF